MTKSETRIFSGIRPSGKLHLGNYLGAIKNWIELQQKADLMVFGVVDYHAITTPYDPASFQEQVMEAVRIYLAAGVDPERSLLIRQSKIPEHTELAWLFGTMTPVGWLERLPTYREKLKQVEESGSPRAKSYQNTLGILAYPVLMTADILLYKADTVPVGEDQRKHLDIVNEIGNKFNHLFGETFQPVKAHIVAGARILSLSDPRKKMSKTGDDPVGLLDDPDAVRAKIKKAVTDSGHEIQFDEKQKPAISNLLTIYSLLSGRSVADIEKQYASNTSYAQFKEDTAEVVVEYLKPFQAKYKELESDPGYVATILTKSEEKARIIAAANLSEIKKRMGVQ